MSSVRHFYLVNQPLRVGRRGMSLIQSSDFTASNWPSQLPYCKHGNSEMHFSCKDLRLMIDWVEWFENFGEGGAGDILATFWTLKRKFLRFVVQTFCLTRIIADEKKIILKITLTDYLNQCKQNMARALFTSLRTFKHVKEMHISPWQVQVI